MPRGYSQPGKSSLDLYTERDRLGWPFRTVTTVSVWFILGAYIYAAEIFTSEADNLKPTRNTLVALAVAMIVLGYISLVVAALRSRSVLFRYECVALPLLTSSVGGLWAIVMNHALHKKFPVVDTYIVVPLVLASVSTVFCIGYSSYLFYQIKQIRRTDGNRPIPLLFEDQYQPSGMPSPGMPYSSPGAGYQAGGNGFASPRMGDASASQGLLPQQYSRA